MLETSAVEIACHATPADLSREPVLVRPNDEKTQETSHDWRAIARPSPFPAASVETKLAVNSIDLTIPNVIKLLIWGTLYYLSQLFFKLLLK
jgi:hypothetical protein